MSTASQIREQARGLEQAAQEQERKEGERNERFALLEKQTEKNRRAFLEDVARQARDLGKCEGTPTDILCPLHSGVWNQTAFVGPDDREAIQNGMGGTESGGVYLARLRRLKTGQLICPVCKTIFSGAI